MLKIIRKLNNIFKRNYSALYVTGDKAKENYAVLVPHLDFTTKLKNMEALETNLQKRQSTFNLEVFKEQWKVYEAIESSKKALERRRIEIVEEMKTLEDENEKNNLRIQGVMVREDLKSLKENSYSIIDRFVNKFLAIPNELHEKTPANSEVILYHYKPESSLSSVPSLDQLELKSSNFYMKQDASLMDLFLPMHLVDIFRGINFKQISNPDFARSLLVEATGEPLDSLHLVEEEVENKNKLNLLHLCGGSSLLGYLGYVTKLSLQPSAFPVKLISNGKQYLRDEVQSNAITIFVSTPNEEDAVKISDATIEKFKEFYNLLNLEYRIVQVPASKLKQAESYRVNVEFKAANSCFVEVGNLSYYSNYISKRILFNYREGKDYKFPHIVSGTALKSVSLIKILMENGVKSKDLKFLDVI